jgi:hypothetical protein
MKRGITFFSLILCAVLILESVAPATGQDSPDCEIDRGPCSRTIGEMTVIIDITPKPVKAMEELVFHLIIKPGQSSPGELFIDLSMPGMYMGTNRVILKKAAEGTYAGKGVIPKCPSGRRAWRATVEMPDAGKIGFTFNVTY